MSFYTKLSPGMYVFEMGEPGVDRETFLAVRNEAGFAHRDWALWSAGDTSRCLVDDLPTRDACAAEALRRLRSARAARAALAAVGR